MIGYEEKELMADVLDDAANKIGKAIRVVEAMTRRDFDTIRIETESADTVLIDGAKVMRALRELQRRYVR